MKKYQSYKPSGVDWIGDIPIHWENRKFRFLFYEKKSVSNLSLNCGSISFGKVIYKDDEGVPDERKETYQEVLKGEFLINPLNLNFDLKSLRIGLSDIDVIVSSGYIVLKLIEDNSVGFFKYLLRTFDTQHMKSLGNGVRQTISFKHLSSEELVLPPLQEQLQIVQFLDEKTELIERLISTKERKITILKEQRTSVINQVVTKGLNPNVKMKDSGVEWIGEIPEGWSISKLKYNGVFFSGYSFNSGDFLSEGEIRVIKISNIQNNGISWDDLSFVPIDFYDKYQNFIVQKGDLIFVLTRPIISTGIKICFYDEDYKVLLNQRNSVFRPSSHKLNKIFTYYLVRTRYFFEEFKQQLKETNQPNISTEQISNIKIFLPPIGEQLQIIEHLDSKTKEIDDLVELEQKKISSLKEYRQSLISEVVTGKIKVTN
jgi:type I restriction enzyme S subunit